MDTYTIDYKMTYTMTLTVKADSEEEAIKKAQSMEGEGDEGDVECHGWEVIDVEEHELTAEEIRDLKRDEAYDRYRDSLLED